MNNRKNEFDNFFDELSFDDERNNINVIKKNVKRKARIHGVVTSMRNLALGIIFLGGVTVVGVNTNSAFAESVSHLPIIGKWISQTQQNDLKAAIENDCETIVNQTVNIKGGKITIPYCIADESNFVFAISGDFEKKGTSAIIDCISITNLDDNETREYSHLCTKFGETSEKIETNEIFDWLYDEDSNKNWNYPNRIRLNLRISVFPDDGDDSLRFQKVSCDITLKEAVKAKEYNLNKDFTVQGQTITITRTVVYPTCTKIYYRENPDNSMECLHISFSLKSKDGKKIGNKEFTSCGEKLENEECFALQSGYYLMGDDFDIILNEVYFLNKDNKVITLDTKTNQIYDAHGLVTDIYIPKKDDDKLNEYIWNSSCFENVTPIVVPNACANLDKGTALLASLDFLSGDEYEDRFIDTTCGGLEETGDVIWGEIPNDIIKNDSDGIIKFEKTYPEVCCYPNIVINK